LLLPSLLLFLLLLLLAHGLQLRLLRVQIAP
jgi:hypothetical protein